jgi:RimJ/RimL family protein N-acetyltransferase
MASDRHERPLVDPGAMLSSTHGLADGSRVRLRLTRPTDLSRIEAFLDRLSPETRRRRFLSATPKLPASLVRHFAFYDPRERMMVAAAMPGNGGEQLIGLADVALLDTGLAEIGVVVGDDAQGQGVGKLLSEAVASLALQRGASHLKAEMAHGNVAMMHLMERIGPTIRTVEDGTTVAYTRLPASRRRHAA